MKRKYRVIFSGVVLLQLLCGCAMRTPMHVQKTTLSTAMISTSEEENLIAVDDAASQEPLLKNKISILLPLSGPLETAGKSVLQGIMASYYMDQPSQRPEMEIYDTYALGSNEALTKAIESRAGLIIGPLSHREVDAVKGRKVRGAVWILLNYTPDMILGKHTYQFGLSYEQEALGTVQLLQRIGYQHVLLLREDSPFAKRIADMFAQEWGSTEGHILTSFTFDQYINPSVGKALLVSESRKRAKVLTDLLNINFNFTLRRRNDIDAIFLITDGHKARRVKPALNFYFARNIPVFSLSSTVNSVIKEPLSPDLNGVICVAAPWISKRKTFTKDAFFTGAGGKQDMPLYALGVDVFKIYPYLSRLSQDTDVLYPGYTGKLFVEDSHYIKRKFSWGKIYNGKVDLLSNFPSFKGCNESTLPVS